MKSKNPNFLYSVDLDDIGRLKNLLWADGQSREAYESYGGIFTFDTMYLTNKYYMPFARFLGLKHHGQSILLGCGLVSREMLTHSSGCLNHGNHICLTCSNCFDNRLMKNHAEGRRDCLP